MTFTIHTSYDALLSPLSVGLLPVAVSTWPLPSVDAGGCYITIHRSETITVGNDAQKRAETVMEKQVQHCRFRVDKSQLVKLFITEH